MSDQRLQNAAGFARAPQAAAAICLEDADTALAGQYMEPFKLCVGKALIGIGFALLDVAKAMRQQQMGEP